MRSIFKSLTNGSLPYAQLPEETTLPLAQFSSQNRVTSAMKDEAPKHTISTYGFHDEALTFDDIKQLIWLNKAIVFLVRIGDEFWTDKNGHSSWNEADILPLRTPTQVVSGHFIVGGAYDENYIYFGNWWSDSWGRKGYGYFGENYLPQITEVGTVVDDVSKVTVPLYNWTRDLNLGMSGSDVKALQQWLNANGYPVAPAGHPGSAGNETDYYGIATTHAVAQFQTDHGIKPTKGYFGPITRDYIKKNYS
jgi:hypothetical protein